MIHKASQAAHSVKSSAASIMTIDPLVQESCSAMHTSATTPLRTLLRHPLAALVLVFSTVTLSGCAIFTPSTPEKIVEKRATEYWNARIAGQYEKVYALSAPSYRKLRTEPQFKTKFGSSASIERAEVSKIECSTDKCNVQLKVGVKPAIPGVKLGTIDTFVNEIWLMEDGKWWHYQEI